ncbi:MAG: hypothetical protein LBD12_00795, partial [Clostridiales Family XIII bacterium]|nr:hypothetical protein [Clostridiales Family XIII bacterium]
MNRKSLKVIVGITLALSLFLSSVAIVHATQATAASETGGGGTHALKLLSDQLSPKDGSENLQQQNVGIKLFFDGDVTDESVRELNGGKFAFTDGKGKVIPSQAYFYGREDSGYILLLVTPKATKDNKGAMLGNKTPYKLTIKSGLSSSDGRVLPEDITLSYRTVDMSGNTQVYMLLMVLMVVGMIGMTIFQNKRKAKAEAEVAAK